MARRTGITITVARVPPPRPRGSLLLADESGAQFARDIHGVDVEFHDTDEDCGIDTVRESSLKYYDPKFSSED